MCEMKKRFTEDQIVKTVTRLKNGTPVKELSRELGVTPTTLYAWQRKYKNLTVSEAKKLRSLEAAASRAWWRLAKEGKSPRRGFTS